MKIRKKKYGKPEDDFNRKDQKIIKVTYKRDFLGEKLGMEDAPITRKVFYEDGTMTMRWLKDKEVPLNIYTKL